MTEAFVFRHALSDLMRLKRVLPWLVVCLGLAGLAAVFIQYGPKASPRELYGQLSSTLVFRVLPLLSAFFTTAVVSGEVEQRTIVYLLTRPVVRGKLLLARALASMIAVALLAMVAAVAVSFAAFGGAALSNQLLVNDFIAILVGSVAYGALFLLISLLVNRAMIVCLLFAFGWETAVPQLPGDVSRLSISTYLEAIARHPSLPDPDNFLAVISGQATGAKMSAFAGFQWMAVFSVVALVLSYMWFSKFEFVPREDAE